MKNLIIYLLMFTFAFGDHYITKNFEEKKILEKFRNENLTFGIYKTDFYNEKVGENKESINDIINDLFNNYLQLGVELKKDSFNALYSDAIAGKIDGIAFLSRKDERSKYFNFTNTMIDIELFITSGEKQVYSLEDLLNKTVYVDNNSAYIDNTKLIFDENDLNVKIIKVDNLDLYKNDLILTDLPLAFDPKYCIKIGKTSPVSMAINNNLEELVPIINNAINEKYRKKINEKLRDIEIETTKNNFMASLIEDEIEYLELLTDINIAYDKKENSILSYYSKIDDVYKGIVPNILKKIGEILGVKINDLTLNGLNGVDNLNNNKIDILVKPKTKKSAENLIFSKKITDISIYEVRLKSLVTENSKIGIVSDSMEEDLIHRYDIAKNIVEYDDYNLLMEALLKQEVESILISDIEDLNFDRYEIVFFENRPSNLAFSKEDYLLKNILDKAMTKLIHKKDIIDMSILEKETESIILYKTQENEKKFFQYLMGILFIVILGFSIKIRSDILHKKELLKDPLSLLPNRIVFNEFCKKNANSLKGYIFMIGLDNIKDINGTYGHEVGDSIIVEFSSYLRRNFNSEYLFRLISNQFHGFLEKDLEEILTVFKDYKNYCPIMKMYGVTYSVGIYEKDEKDDINLAFKHTGLAMVEAKKEKKFSYKIADEVFIEKKERENEILSSLKGSLDKIYPVFQPKIDLSTNLIIGVEALARWNSEKLGMIYPSEFIPIAEKYKLIYKIDYRIAEESIKLLKNLIETKKIKKDFRLSFNVSVDTFTRKDLVEKISELLKKYDVSGSYIEVEVTESLLVEDMKDIINKLNSLIKLGIQISLDDFTAGHSTAGVLPLLPLSIVKFDKSLLDSFYQNEKKAKIVYLNLISLIKELDLKIVAEGIETSEELRFLKENNVDYGQGYLISKPEPYDEKTTFSLDMNIN